MTQHWFVAPRLCAPLACVLCIAGAAQAQCLDQKLLASDGTTNDAFGQAAAIDGDLLIIGADRAAPNLSGQAYVYRREPTQWVEERILAPITLLPSAGFGAAVDLQGNWAVVGAPNMNRVYVFERGSIVGNPIWVKIAELSPPNPGQTDSYGSTVSIDGNFIAVGAPFVDGAEQNTGAVYIYRWNGASWDSEPTISASSAVAGDTFGQSVSIKGTTVAVGVPRDDDKAFDAGSVKTFTRRVIGPLILWAEGPTITASDGAAGDHFGSSVSYDGTSLAAGAPGVNTGSGAAYAFRREASLWIEEKKVVPNDLVGGDAFGRSVSLGPGFGLFVTARLVVGAPEQDAPGNTRLGAAYLFNRVVLFGGQVVYNPAGKLIGPGIVGGANFGSAVDQDAGNLIVGALGDMTLPLSFTGSAFVYSFSSVDSDGDGVPDPCDLCPGFDDTIDTNGDGIPDGCQCFGDANGDGVVDFNDLNAVLGNWLNEYSPGTGPGDANFDGVVDFNDLNAVLGNWLAVCP